MDGMEATRQIRNLEDVTKAGIPIIALTANALKGDSEKYIAAGMNAYLSKPFDESGLFSTISQNLAPQPNQPAPVTIPKQPVAMHNEQDKIYDLAMVQSVSGGDEAFIRRMIQLFIETMPVSVQELQQETMQQNWPAAGKVAHKMKSTIDSMGIVQLKQDIRVIEQSGKTGENTAAIPALVAQVAKVIDQCIEQLKTDFSL